jgi:hypothetical protein
VASSTPAFLASTAFVISARVCQEQENQVTDTLDQGQEGTQEQGGENRNLAHLREKAERADALEAELAQLRREAAVAKSGIDSDHPLGKFFVEHYDGDISDTEALVAKAKEMGVPIKGAPAFNGTEQPAPGDSEPQPGLGENAVNLEPTGTQQRRALAGEDPQLGEVNEDPRKVALQQAEDAIKEGATFDQAGAHLVSQLAGAASRGDRRVIVTEERMADGRKVQRWT